MTVNKVLININSTIKDAYLKFNTSGERCLFVVSSNNKFLGVLTEGDIRKSILKKKNINFSIKNIYKTSVYYIKNNEFNYIKIKNFFKKYKYNLIPIIENNEVIDYLDYQKFHKIKKFENIKINKNIKIPLVIMAGGKGTRLKPYTNIIPKPLFPYGDSTIIEEIIKTFIPYNISKLFLSINYKKNLIKSYFKESNVNYKISFIEEKKSLGTVGSLYLIKKNIKNDFFLTNCDVLFNIDYNDFYDFHKINKNDISIIVSPKEFTIPYGIIENDKKGNLKKIIEKPKINYLFNCGLYIMNKKILSLIKNNTKCDFNELIDKAKSKKFKIGVFPIDPSNWKDFGEMHHWNNIFEDK